MAKISENSCNSEVLANITKRMMKGERVKGESQDEKDCLQLIHDFLMKQPEIMGIKCM